MVWIVGLIAWGVLGKRLSKPCLIAGLSLLALMSNPLIINLILKKWEAKPVLKDELPLAKTAVVLGGIIGYGQEPSDQIHLNGNSERLEEAISLYHAGLIRRIIFSGGSGALGKGEIKEAEVLREFIIERGVAPDDLILEANSSNTYQNARETALILDKMDFKERSVILITSAFHMPRALRCFKKQGINTISYPVDFKSTKIGFSPYAIIPSASAISTWQFLIWEWMGLMVYKTTGYT